MRRIRNRMNSLLTSVVVLAGATGPSGMRVAADAGLRSGDSKHAVDAGHVVARPEGAKHEGARHDDAKYDGANHDDGDTDGDRHINPAVSALITSLASRDSDERAAATIALCRAHRHARSALREAARGDDVELADRAKHLLQLFDRLWFNGAHLELSFNKKQIPWNEPALLNVTVRNRSDYIVRLPFPRPRAGSISVDKTPRADQVGVMLDLADWLIVEKHDGSKWTGPLGLTADYSMGDTDIVGAVESRVKDGWPDSTISPGATEIIRLPEFNRGWARFRMLDAGRYRVRLDFAPFWNEPSLDREKVGRVVSNWAELEVTKSAPAAVSRREMQASIGLELTAGAITASLVNRLDLPIHVSINMGQAFPFAQVTWLVSDPDGNSIDLPARELRPDELSTFSGERLVELAPGSRIRLASIPLSALREAAADRGLTGEIQLGFSYRNLLDNDSQARFSDRLVVGGSTPAVLRSRLPNRMLVTSLTADPTITVPAAGSDSEDAATP